MKWSFRRQRVELPDENINGMHPGKLLKIRKPGDYGEDFPISLDELHEMAEQAVKKLSIDAAILPGSRPPWGPLRFWYQAFHRFDAGCTIRSSGWLVTHIRLITERPG